MILFRTMIPVASDFTKDDFIDLLKTDVIARSGEDKLCLATADLTKDSLDLSDENERLSCIKWMDRLLLVIKGLKMTC